MTCENRPRGRKTPKRVTANKGKEMTLRNHTHDVVRIKGRELWFIISNGIMKCIKITVSES